MHSIVHFILHFIVQILVFSIMLSIMYSIIWIPSCIFYYADSIVCSIGQILLLKSII